MATRFFSALAGGLLAAFFLGYGAFVANLPDGPGAGAGQTQGIVALTGGGGARIGEALTLLESGSGQRLLVSGVFQDTTPADLRAFGPDGMSRFDCCVDIGREARDTVGNAAETAEWARANGYSSVTVVTHGFHMPRALLELRQAAPEIEFRPWPVGGAFARGPRRATVEYVKFLVILGRDSFAGGARRA